MTKHEYIVFEAKGLREFAEKINQEAANGWRVVAMAKGPGGNFYATMERLVAGS
jgi:hypothetical protein